MDTSVWIDYLRNIANPETAWLNGRIETQGIALTDLILAEVLQGIRNDSLFRKVRQDLLEFSVLDGCGAEVALKSAQNYRILRAEGYTIRKTIDCLIATFCLQEGHSLLHRDRDFDLFELRFGLRVIHPASDSLVLN